MMPFPKKDTAHQRKYTDGRFNRTRSLFLLVGPAQLGGWGGGGVSFAVNVPSGLIRFFLGFGGFHWFGWFSFRFFFFYYFFCLKIFYVQFEHFSNSNSFKFEQFSSLNKFLNCDLFSNLNKFKFDQF
jgi:hypothetical protein